MIGQRAWCAAPAVLLLLCTSFIIAQGEKDKQAKDPKGDTPNYYPLQAGNTWTYKRTVNGEETRVTTYISKVDTIDGVPMARLEISNTPTVEHLVQNSKGVFRTRFNGAELSPPPQLIPYPVKYGEKWKKTFRVDGENVNHVYEGEVGDKMEAVEVPAGKYQAVRVRLKLDADGQQLDATYWFVKDVGVVKQLVEIAGSSHTLELEKFEQKKVEAKPKSK